MLRVELSAFDAPYSVNVATVATKMTDIARMLDIFSSYNTRLRKILYARHPQAM